MKSKSEKNIARKSFSEIRNLKIKNNQKLIYQQVDNYIETFLNTSELRKKYIGIYWPLIGEVDLSLLRGKKNLKFALPHCEKNKTLTYRRWSSEPLGKDFFGIPSPMTNPPLKPEEISTLFIPAFAIDRNGYRLGAGGGFYDRLRSKRNWLSIKAIVILPQCCVSEKPLPRDPWDIPFDNWITENGLLKKIN